MNNKYIGNFLRRLSAVVLSVIMLFSALPAGVFAAKSSGSVKVVSYVVACNGGKQGYPGDDVGYYWENNKGWVKESNDWNGYFDKENNIFHVKNISISGLDLRGGCALYLEGTNFIIDDNLKWSYSTALGCYDWENDDTDTLITTEPGKQGELCLNRLYSRYDGGYQKSCTVLGSDSHLTFGGNAKVYVELTLSGSVKFRDPCYLIKTAGDLNITDNASMDIKCSLKLGDDGYGWLKTGCEVGGKCTIDTTGTIRVDTMNCGSGRADGIKAADIQVKNVGDLEIYTGQDGLLTRTGNEIDIADGLIYRNMKYFDNNCYDFPYDGSGSKTVVKPCSDPVTVTVYRGRINGSAYTHEAQFARGESVYIEAISELSIWRFYKWGYAVRGGKTDHIYSSGDDVLGLRSGANIEYFRFTIPEDLDGTEITFGWTAQNKSTLTSNGDRGTFLVDGDSADTVWLAPEQTAELEAVPNDGYQFDHWEVWTDGVTLTEQQKTSNPMTLSGESNKNLDIRAIFVEKEYKIIYKYVDGGQEFTFSTSMWKNGKPSVSKFRLGQTVTLPAASEITRGGYAFVGWYTDPECTRSAGKELTSNNPENVRLYAKFIQDASSGYRVGTRLNTELDANRGMISVISKAKTGDTVYFTLSPNTGYKVSKNVQIYISYMDANGGGYQKITPTHVAGDTYSFVMPECRQSGVTVIAEDAFELIQYNITYNIGDGKETYYFDKLPTKYCYEGYYTGKDKDILITDDVDLTVSGNAPVKKPGYIFFGWSETENGWPPITKIEQGTRVGDLELYPVWVGTSYSVETIYVDGCSDKGNVEIIGGDSAKYDSTVTFALNPAEGCGVYDVEVTLSTSMIAKIPITDNGDGTYSFTMPGENVKIRVEFQREYNIFTDYNPGVVLTPMNKPGTDEPSLSPCMEGKWYYFTLRPAAGYVFGSDFKVYANGTEISKVGNNDYYAVTPNGGNITLSFSGVQEGESGLTLTGTVTSFGNIEDYVELELVPLGESEAAYSVTASPDSKTGLKIISTYAFTNVEPGSYTMRITKKGHVIGEYDVDVTDPNTTVNAEIYLKGDINGDGVVNLQDIAALAQYIAQWDITVNTVTLDINGDGVVNLQDIATLAQYIAQWDGIELSDKPYFKD